MLGLLSDVLAEASRTLVAIAFGSGAIALVCWVALVRRLERRFSDRPLRPVGLARKLLVFVVAVAASTVAVLGAFLLAALGGQHRAVEGARIAEVQCIERGPGSLRLYLVPLDRLGLRGETHIFDLKGARCAVTGELLRLSPAFRAIGPAYAKVVRVSGKPAREEDGNDKRTTFALGDEGSGWWATHGAHGPLRIMTADTDGNTVAVEPDSRATYDLTVTLRVSPEGQHDEKSGPFVLAKRK